MTFAGADPDDERAEGLHAERTDLAWTRSGLALLGAFAILARRVWTAGPESEDALAVALLGLATIGWAVGILGWGLTRRRRDEPAARSPQELLAVSLGTIALAAAGLVISVVNT